MGYGPLAWIKAGLQFFADFTSGSTEQILSGWTFAVPLLGILLIHELGHFVAARRYAVDASPPYFLPVPPTLSPIGSLGAFLRLRSVVVDRRQLLDIGAAGPLAGFVVTLAVLVWGYATSQPVPSGEGPHGLIVRFAQGYFVVGESLLLRGLREHYFPGVTSIQLSLPAFAGWAGSFITGLNLLPLSQLDGGHVSYGLVGKRQTVTAWLAVLGLLYLSWHTPAWLIWIVLTLLVGAGRWAHPSVLSPERPVPRSRVVIGWICLVVLALTFVPVPFSQ
jgi:membrane-associated protease RseP (regulator of RpoE activity)